MAKRYLSISSQRLQTDDRGPNSEVNRTDHVPTELKSSPGNEEIIQLAKYEYEFYKDERPHSVPVHVSVLILFFFF